MKCSKKKVLIHFVDSNQDTKIDYVTKKC